MKNKPFIIFSFAIIFCISINTNLYAREIGWAPTYKPEVVFTEPADIAFKETMNVDLSFGKGNRRTQMGAIHAWEELLKRNDISDVQRLYATWRIASLYGYNYNPERGEQTYPDISVKKFGEVIHMIDGFYSLEKINAATHYSSFPGTHMERAKRNLYLCR